MNEPAKDPEFVRLNFARGAPKGICRKCAKRGVLHSPTQTAILYCQHGLCGAYRAPERPWKVIPDINAQDFRAVVLREVTVGELRVELARHFAEVLREDAKEARRR